MIFLLPPCNSDTLQHILHFLSTVASHADDHLAGDGAEVRFAQVGCPPPQKTMRFFNVGAAGIMEGSPSREGEDWVPMGKEPVDPVRGA